MQALTKDGSKRCQALTKSGTQCTRKAEPNSLYCWQHQDYKTIEPEIKVNPILLQKSLQPGILSNILITAGYTGLNQQTSLIVNNEYISLLDAWFKRIKVKTSIQDILTLKDSNKQLQFLIQIYNQRINDRPNSDLISALSDKGFDWYILYSRRITIVENTIPMEIWDNIVDLLNKYHGAEDEVISTEDYNTIYQSISPFIQKLRQGDIVEFSVPQYIDLPSNSLLKSLARGDKNLTLIWNDSRFESLSMEVDIRYNLPQNIFIQEYPIVDYFRYSIYQNNLVWLKTIKDRNYKFDYTLLESFSDYIDKYQTGDGYIVYANRNYNFDRMYKDSEIPLDYLTNSNLDSFYDYLENWFGDDISYEEKEEVIEDIRETLKTNRLVLSQSNLEDY